MNPDEIVGTLLILGGLTYWATCGARRAADHAAHLYIWWAERKARRTAERVDPHGVIPVAEVDEQTRHHVAQLLALYVATGVIPDDTYVWWLRRCPEHGRHLCWAPADLVALRTTADLPKEWIA